MLTFGGSAGVWRLLPKESWGVPLLLHFPEFVWVKLQVLELNCQEASLVCITLISLSLCRAGKETQSRDSGGALPVSKSPALSLSHQQGCAA